MSMVIPIALFVCVVLVVVRRGEVGQISVEIKACFDKS